MARCRRVVGTGRAFATWMVRVRYRFAVGVVCLGAVVGEPDASRWTDQSARTESRNRYKKHARCLSTTVGVGCHDDALRLLASHGTSTTQIGWAVVLDGVWPVLQGITDKSTEFLSRAADQRRREPLIHIVSDIRLDVSTTGSIPDVRAVATTLSIPDVFTVSTNAEARTDFPGFDDNGVDLLLLNGLRTGPFLRDLLVRLAGSVHQFIAIFGTDANGIESTNETFASELLSSVEAFLAMDDGWRVNRHYSLHGGLSVLVLSGVGLTSRGENPTSSTPVMFDTGLEFFGTGKSRLSVYHNWIEYFTWANKPEDDKSPWELAKREALAFVSALTTGDFGQPFGARFRKLKNGGYVEPFAIMIIATYHCPGWADADFDLGKNMCRQPKLAGDLAYTLIDKEHGPWQAHLLVGVLSSRRLLQPSAFANAQGHLETAARKAPWSRHAIFIASRELELMGLTGEAWRMRAEAVMRGVWFNEYQRPIVLYFPRLTNFGLGWLQEATLPDSLRNVRSAVRARFAGIRQEAIAAAKTGLNEASYSRGWKEIPIYSIGWHAEGPEGCDLKHFPKICRILGSLPNVILVRARLTMVSPPTTVIEHNPPLEQGRLRMLCVVSFPRGGTNMMTVGKEARNLTEEGTCNWFDESFDHRVEFHHTRRGRIAFYLDVLHPDLVGMGVSGSPESVETPPFSVELPPFGAPDILQRLRRGEPLSFEDVRI